MHRLLTLHERGDYLKRFLGIGPLRAICTTQRKAHSLGATMDKNTLDLQL